MTITVTAATCAVGAIVDAAGSSTLNGTAGDDLVYGLGGNDRLNGGAGTNTIDGGLGNDECRNPTTGPGCPDRSRP